MGILGSLVGGVLNAFNRGKTPQLTPATLVDPTYGQTAFLQQKDQIPGVGNLLGQAEDLNTQYFQKNLLKYAPSYKDSLGLMGSQAALMGQGKVPITIGGKQYSPLDLGITSDDLMKASVPALGGAVKADEAFNPFHYSTDANLFKPQDLLMRQDALDYHNSAIQNQRNLIKSKQTNPWLSGLSGLIGGLGI